MIYLNNAASSYPKPAAVTEAVTAALAAPPVDGARAGFEPPQGDTLAEARRCLAGLIGAARPDEILFTAGATAGLNLALRGLLRHGAHVVTTVTEHNSVLRPLKHLEREGRITLSLAPCDRWGLVAPPEVAARLRDDTAMVVVNHCSNVTGVVQDVAALGRLAHAAGALLVVDGAQSVGAVPVDVQAQEIDVLAMAGHKGLFGPPGVGALYVADHLDPTPLIVGGTGVRSELLYQPLSRPIRYEAGTANLPGIAGLTAGTRYVQAQGVECIARQKAAHVRRLAAALRELPRVTIYGDPETTATGGCLAFNVEGFEPDEVGYVLEHSFGIVTRAGLHCAPLIHAPLGCPPTGCVRMSPSHLTGADEIDAAIEALQAVAQSAVPV